MLRRAPLILAITGEGTSAPPVVERIYLGLSTDLVISPDELNILTVDGEAYCRLMRGFSVHYWLIARLATLPDITVARINNGENQIGGFQKMPMTVVPTGETEPYNVWRSNWMLSNAPPGFRLRVIDL